MSKYLYTCRLNYTIPPVSQVVTACKKTTANWIKISQDTTRVDYITTGHMTINNDDVNLEVPLHTDVIVMYNWSKPE